MRASSTCLARNCGSRVKVHALRFCTSFRCGMSSVSWSANTASSSARADHRDASIDGGLGGGERRFRIPAPPDRAFRSRRAAGRSGRAALGDDDLEAEVLEDADGVARHLPVEVVVGGEDPRASPCPSASSDAGHWSTMSGTCPAREGGDRPGWRGRRRRAWRGTRATGRCSQRVDDAGGDGGEPRPSIDRCGGIRRPWTGGGAHRSSETGARPCRWRSVGINRAIALAAPLPARREIERLPHRLVAKTAFDGPSPQTVFLPQEVGAPAGGVPLLVR